MKPTKENPDISIVLPTYNVGKYIDRCLASCVNQSHKEIEIIVIDDCGNDDSIEKARLWASKDPRIKIIHNPRNLGTYHARRRGVESSSGQYIIFLDPDDSLDFSAAQEIFAAAQTSSPDIIFFGITEIQKNTSGKIKIKKQNAPNLRGDLKKYFTQQKRTSLGTPGKAYLKSKLHNAFSLAAVPEEERLIYGEDVLILFSALHLSSKGLSINKNLYNYHINESSITVQKSIADVRFQQQQLEQVLRHLKKISIQTNKYKKNQNLAIHRNFSAKLSSDKYMLARHTLNESGEDKYFHSITFAFFERPTLKDFIRISLHIGSMGRLRF